MSRPETPNPSPPAAAPPGKRLDDVWVVVPVYNEATVLEAVLKALVEVFPHVAVIDDASSDGSAAIAERFRQVRVVRHPVNLGQGAALQTGIAYVLGDRLAQRIVTFDGDGQHRVEDGLALVAALGEAAPDGRAAQVVLGTRFGPGGARPGPLRRAVLKAAVAYTRRSVGLQVTDTHNGLRAFTREAAQGLDLRQGGMAHATEILEQVKAGGFAYIERPVRIEYTPYSRHKGQSSLNAVNILVDLFMRPIR
jgi:glycosyltransferase involved in cell wall biosynthesis